LFPDPLLLLRVKQTHGVFSRPGHDPDATFEALLLTLEAHEREWYLTITQRIPDRTLHDGAVVAIVCELTTKGEAELIKAGPL
jgi:hypothetical protein